MLNNLLWKDAHGLLSVTHGWQFGSHDCVETGKTSFKVNILICVI